MAKSRIEKITKSEYEQKLLEVRRVTRVVAGGKRLSFRVAILLGDKKGKVALGVAKGADVSIAIEKATNDAKKHFILVPINDKGTINHEVRAKFKASKVVLKPAAEGRGIIAGGAVREVLKLTGLKNVMAKLIGTTTNKINNAQAAIEALKKIKAKNI